MTFKDGGTVGHLKPGPGTSVSGPGGKNNPGNAKGGTPPPNPIPDQGKEPKPFGAPKLPDGQPNFNGETS